MQWPDDWPKQAIEIIEMLSNDRDADSAELRKLRRFVRAVERYEKDKSSANEMKLYYARKTIELPKED